jgi:hypothetical protein
MILLLDYCRPFSNAGFYQPMPSPSIPKSFKRALPYPVIPPKSQNILIRKNQLWSEQFAEFIKNLCKDNEPEIVETHPPFDDYCRSITEFTARIHGFQSAADAEFLLVSSFMLSGNYLSLTNSIAVDVTAADQARLLAVA